MKKLFFPLLTALILLLLILSTLLVVTPKIVMRTTGTVAGTSLSGAPSMGMAYDMDVTSMRGNDAYAEKMISPILPPQPETAGQTAAEVDQKIIRTGGLSLVVEDVRGTAGTIGSIAEGVGGYVQTSNISERGDGTLYGSVTIRVPSDRFTDVLTETKKLATLVQDETTDAQDVTEEYTDLDAQLRNAKAQEAEYLNILSRAESVQDILAVQSYLSGTRAQIEQLQGRLQYLENRTAYATLSISLSEEPSIMAPTGDFRPGSAAREAIQALVGVLQSLVVLGIWTIIVGGPFLIILGLITFLVVKLVRRLMQNAK